MQSMYSAPSDRDYGWQDEPEPEERCFECGAYINLDEHEENCPTRFSGYLQEDEHVQPSADAA